jgi:hypothetical protein
MYSLSDRMIDELENTGKEEVVTLIEERLKKTTKSLCQNIRCLGRVSNRDLENIIQNCYRQSNPSRSQQIYILIWYPYCYQLWYDAV